MRSLIVIASTAALLLATACAKAHFVWVAIETNDHKAVAHLYFHESAAPSAPRLIKHIAQSKLWARSADGKVDHLEAKIVVRGDVASLAAPINTVSPYSVEADCLYGVYSVDDKPVLLHYYAKSFYENPGDFSALGRAKGLGLDIVPSITPAGLQLQVLRQGKPAVGSEIVVVSPSEKETSLKTDQTGVVQIKSLAHGRYAIRARVIENAPGNYQGKKYEETWHYCTLLLDISKSQTTVSKTTSAPDLFFKARKTRAIWDDFPGFSASIRVNIDGKSHRGKIVVNADGDVELSGIKLNNKSHVVQSLDSLMGHRLSDSDFTEDVSYADDDNNHPLGRLIQLDYDSEMASTYRIKNNMIRQVNRETGGGQFTISVFSFQRNKENKVLPESYNVCIWNKEGALVSSITVRDEWARVGSFDLPTSHTAVIVAGKNSYSSVQIEFSNHKLAKRAKE